jgi:hypothetical protein
MTTTPSLPRSSRSAPDAARWLALLDEALRCADSGRVLMDAVDDRAAHVRSAVLRILRGEVNAARSELRAAAFALEEVDDDLVLVREVGTGRSGCAFLVRVHGAQAPALCLQTSHGFDEDGTLPIAVEVFARSGARALFVGDHGASALDVEHSAASVLRAATEAFTHASRCTMVQIHGFRRRRAAAVVVSGSEPGAAFPPVVLRTVRALRAALGDATDTLVVQGEPLEAHAPGVVSRLGGTFVLVEIGASLLRGAVESALLRELVASALASGLTGMPIPAGVL